MTFINTDKQIDMIQQGVEEIIPIDELKHKLDRGQKSNKPCLLYTSDAADE